MRVKKGMINKELQKSVSKLKIINFFLSRKWGVLLIFFLSKLYRWKKIKGLNTEQLYIKSHHGEHDIRIRIYKPENHTSKLPAMLYCHGGGYFIGVPEQSNELFKKFIENRPCIVIAPDYRKSPEEPFPAAFDDCYDTLIWMKKNADSIGAFDDKIIVAGHSAGGGLTAAITLKARDTQDVNIAFQMPVYPMIDDRQITESSQFTGVPVWDAKTNALAWRWYLKDLKQQNKEIPAYAAPARNRNYKKFPPTISLVGSVEPFRDETIQYINALKKENIPVKFKLFKGCFHAFDLTVPNSEIGKEALDFTFRSYIEYYDKYCAGL